MDCSTGRGEKVKGIRKSDGKVNNIEEKKPTKYSNN
jgi:hypothetical protein